FHVTGVQTCALPISAASSQGAVYLGILRGEEDGVTADQQLMIGTNDRRFHSFGVQTLARHEAYVGPVESRLELGLRLHGDVVRRSEERRVGTEARPR